MADSKTTLEDCHLVDLPQVTGNRLGSLTYIYSSQHVPFAIERLYYLYDVPGGAERAGHAHRELRQLLLSASGSFDVLLDDGLNSRVINLNRPYYGLYIPPLIWRRLINFSSGSVCLALVSLAFDENDYIHDYKSFVNLKMSGLK